MDKRTTPKARARAFWSESCVGWAAHKRPRFKMPGVAPKLNAAPFGLDCLLVHNTVQSWRKCECLFPIFHHPLLLGSSRNVRKCVSWTLFYYYPSWPLRRANFSQRVCGNPAFWLSLAACASFTQPFRNKYALQSSKIHLSSRRVVHISIRTISRPARGEERVLMQASSYSVICKEVSLSLNRESWGRACERGGERNSLSATATERDGLRQDSLIERAADCSISLQKLVTLWP